jgi:hypothetical protein
MRDDVVVLCLLRAGSADGLSASTFKVDLRPLLAIGLSPVELREAEKSAGQWLISQDLVVRPKGARSRLSLTKTGRAEAARLLGIKAWPTEDPSWAKLAKPALAGRALGLSTMEYSALKSVESLRQEIVRRLLGREPKRARLSAEDKSAALAAVGAVKGDRSELERRLAARGAAKLKVRVPDSEEIVDFADEVLRLARAQRSGRVGRDLVLINHVWKAYCAAHPQAQLDLGTFKERLREAWRAHRMPLAIANVLDPKFFADVRESRINDGRQEWHVIDLQAA